MNFHEFFGMVRERFIAADVSGIEGKLAIQINLTGEAAGAFYIELKDKKLSIEPYTYHDRDVAITVSDVNFKKLMDGKADPVLLFTMGKLRVEGDLGKALELKRFL